MSATVYADRTNSDAYRWWWALSAAALIELSLILIATGIWAHSEASPEVATVLIEWVQEKPMPVTPPEPTRPVRDQTPKAAVRNIQTTTPQPLTPTERAEPAAEVRAPQPMPAVREPAATNVTSTPASQPTPAPDHSEYMAKVRAAVQQAFVYPAAASSLGLHGRVKVRFRLTQKTPANAQVVTSSGVSMIDRAAISSVLAARYPEPAADMNLNQMEFEIWIEYRPS